jgi:hypothetical protein
LWLAQTAGVTSWPEESAPTPITDTAYDDHHRPSRVTRYLSAADGGNRATETEYHADDSVKRVRKAVGSGLEHKLRELHVQPERNGGAHAVRCSGGPLPVLSEMGH